MRPRLALQLVTVAGTLGLASASLVACAEDEPKVRPCHGAGFWYAAGRAALTEHVDELLKGASPPSIPGKPIAVISPHAGYPIAGPVTATGYCCLRGHAYKRVIVIGFSHQRSWAYRGVEVTGELTAYKTPLGEVPIDREVCDRLLRERLFQSKPDIDRGEHSLENLLPFLQRVLEDFRIVPLLVGQMSEQDYAEAARAILPFIDDQTLLMASSDFTHFGRGFGYEPFKRDVPNQLRELADQAAAPILKCDFDGFVDHLAKTRDTICGPTAISLLLRILSMQAGAEGVRTGSDISGRITGDWSRSVTYQSFVLTRRPQTLDQPAREKLLKLARQTVTAHLSGAELPEPDPAKLPAELLADGGCFVTLESRGQLRGCIGNLKATGPLHEAVIHNAMRACQDRRFVLNPVTAKEVDQLHIELSCLTPKTMKRVANPDEIVVGRHGLVIALGDRGGLLLPQIAYRRGWTREGFLAQTCRKAGLPPDAWRRPEAEIHTFEAEVFGEPEP